MPKPVPPEYGRIGYSESPKDCFRRAFDALHSGDKAGILQNIYAPKGEEKTLQALAEYGDALHAFDEAMVRRFGEKETDGFLLNKIPSGEAFREVIDNAPMSIQGDSAILADEIHFIRRKSHWQLRLTDVIGIMQCGHIKNFDVVLQNMTERVRATIPEISQPGASPGDIRKKIDERINEATKGAEVKEEYGMPK